MKWNKENKDRINAVLFDKVLAISGIVASNVYLRNSLYRIWYGGHSSRIRERAEWDLFLNSMGIKKVRRKPIGRTLRYGPWMLKKKPAADHKHIIARDFFFQGIDAHKYGLKIPKDIAEKFLVLGIP